MTKQEQINDPNSCWNKAKPDEEVFVLLARDLAAPNTIREWVEIRRSCGRGETLDDKLQLLDAERVAEKMEEQYDSIPIKTSDQRPST